jgi:ketosteroid isomerase-like protein
MQIVRQPIRLSAQSRRRLEERLSLRFPRLPAAVNRGLFRLPARSRVRRLMFSRTVQLTAEASNRGDYEVAFMHYHPDVELNSPPGNVGIGTFPETLFGREERIRFERGWRDGWDDFRYEPEELIDLADQRILLLGRMMGSGPASGAVLESEWADLLTISRGQVIREQVFFSRAEALHAAGLSE